MEPIQHHIAKTAAHDSPVILSDGERARHVYVVGKSGVGKSTLLYNLAMHDILAGHGVAVIDPHGDLAEKIADHIPRSRTNEVCYLNVADMAKPVGFNPLAGVTPKRRALAAAGMTAAFRHLWGNSWGARSEHFLLNGISALLHRHNATLLDLPRMYTDATFRDHTVRRVTDPSTREFWLEEYPSYDAKYRKESAGPILNKAGQFGASPNVRAIIGQASPRFDLAYAMDNRRILIANLSKGAIGEMPSNLIGSLIVSHLQLVAMERSGVSEERRIPFRVHIDEFQSFGTDAFASLLSEARKYGAHFCLSHQFTEQLSPLVRAAVMGNVGTLFVYRVSGADAKLLAPEFHPLEPNTLASQNPFRAWLRRAGFEDVHPICPEPDIELPGGRLETVIEQSRRHFGRALDKAQRENMRKKPKNRRPFLGEGERQPLPRPRVRTTPPVLERPSGAPAHSSALNEFEDVNGIKQLGRPAAKKRRASR